MRGPKDALIDAAASPVERGSRPPGGKVLQRLALFHDARGFPVDGVIGLEEERPQRSSVFLSRNNGTKPGNGRQRWFTFNWPATWHVIWTVMPTTVRPGAPQITWQVQVERASVEYVTYWITVSNLTPDGVSRHGKASFA